MRDVRRVAVLLLSAAGLALGCVGERNPHPGIGRLWNQFLAMPPKRALALAGDPDALWVGAAVGGFRSQPEASEAALAECQRKRHERRMLAPCQLYAIGSQIVWPPG